MLFQIKKLCGRGLCRASVFADIAQLGERQTEDLKVPGSIPGVGICIFMFCSNALWNTVLGRGR